MKRFLYALAVAAGGSLPFAAADDVKKPAPAEDVKKPAPAEDVKKPVPAEGVKKPVPAEGVKKPVPADGVKKPAPDGVKKAVTVGRIGKIDTAKKTLTLVRKGDGGLREDDFTLAADAVVLIDGKPGKLESLKAEQIVEIATGGENKAVTEIRVSGQKFSGLVKATTADSLTFAGKDGNERTVKLAEGAKVLIQGKAGKLTGLENGAKVFVQLTVDETGAILVTDGAPAAGDKPKPGVKPEGDKPGVKPEKPGVKPEGDKKPGVKPAPEKPGEKKPEGAKPAVEK